MRRKLGILILLIAVCGVVGAASVQAVDGCSFCLARCERQHELCIASGQTHDDCNPAYWQCNNNCEANHCP